MPCALESPARPLFIYPQKIVLIMVLIGKRNSKFLLVFDTPAPRRPGSALSVATHSFGERRGVFLARMRVVKRALYFYHAHSRID